MRNHLYVDGKDLADFGVYVSGQGTFKSPQKEVTFYDVPGRPGALLGASSRLANVDVTYPAFISENVRVNMRDLRSYLLSRDGYVEIRDTYNTDETRLGVYTGALDPQMTPKHDAGEFDLTFNCKPQRWLTSGNTMIEVLKAASPYTITNPTHFNCQPLLRVYFTGAFAVNLKNPSGVNEYMIASPQNLTSLGYSYIDIDCETMHAWNGNDVLDGYMWWEPGVRKPNVYTPVLVPGTNTVELPSTFVISGVTITNKATKVDVTPRWWEV